VLPLAPWLLLGACGGLFSAWMERTIIGAGGAEFALTPVQRGLVAGRAICFYLGKLAWPADLMFIYPRWNVNPAVGWQYLFPLAVLVLLAALGWVARRRRGPLAAFLLFVGTLFPSLGFLNVYPFVFSYVADHFQYLACLGILAPVASMLTAATARLPTATRRAIPILGGVLLTMLAVLTWRQSTQYGDAETLFRETLARNPACWMAHNNLGNILAKIPGRLPEAMAHYESALQTRPDFAEAHFNLANALAETPEHRPEAIVHYEAALRGKPDYPEAHNNLGETLAKIAERRPQAIAQFEAALRINPEFAEAHNNLGVALSSAPDRRPQAIAQFEAALRARPDFAEAHFNLANLLAKTPDRLPEAIAQYEAALRGKPDFAEAHFNLGWVLLRMPDRQQDGLAHFEAALRIQPDLAPAREMLDRLRAIQR
jgi:tetratricopeptide (TPR) repeat protein